MIENLLFQQWLRTYIFSIIYFAIFGLDSNFPATSNAPQFHRALAKLRMGGDCQGVRV